MRILKINGTRYQEPESIYDIKLSQLDGIVKAQQQLKEAEKEQDIAIRSVRIVDAYCKIIAACTDIPYEELIVMPDALDQNLKISGPLKSIFIPLLPVLENLEYKQSEEKIRYFDFEPHTGWRKKSTRYYLFDFGDSCVAQQLWFQTEWRDFFADSVEKVKQLDMSVLPKLIATIAFPKNEIKMAFDKPDRLIEDVYNELGNKIGQRAHLFKDLPISVAYKCIDYFFLKYPEYQKIMKMCFPNGIQAYKRKRKNSTGSTTELKVE